MRSSNEPTHTRHSVSAARADCWASGSWPRSGRRPATSGRSGASNAVYEVDEGRPYWKLRPLQIALTIAAVLSISLSAFSVALTGAVAESAGDVLGIGGATVTA